MSFPGNLFKALAVPTVCLSLWLFAPAAKAQSSTPYLQWSSGGFEVFSPNGEFANSPSMFAGMGYQETVSVSGLPAGSSATVTCNDTAQGQILSWSTDTNGSYSTSWTVQNAGPNNVSCELFYTGPNGSGDVGTGIVSIRVY